MSLGGLTCGLASNTSTLTPTDLSCKKTGFQDALYSYSGARWQNPSTSTTNLITSDAIDLSNGARTANITSSGVDLSDPAYGNFTTLDTDQLGFSSATASSLMSRESFSLTANSVNFFGVNSANLVYYTGNQQFIVDTNGFTSSTLYYVDARTPPNRFEAFGTAFRFNGANYTLSSPYRYMYFFFCSAQPRIITVNCANYINLSLNGDVPPLRFICASPAVVMVLIAPGTIGFNIGELVGTYSSSYQSQGVATYLLQAREGFCEVFRTASV